VVFIGKAQEKCAVYRTEKRHNPKKNTVLRRNSPMRAF
jgi:hypothetical protein